MANPLAWSDFNVITGKLQECESKTVELYNLLVNLNDEKTKIVDDPARLAGITEIINIHPDWAVADIASRINVLKLLGIYIHENGLD